MNANMVWRRCARYHLLRARTWVFLSGLLWVVLSPCAAAAHPHVWIDAQVEIITQGTAVLELAQQWRFDPFFSSLMIEDFDKDKNGVFDGAETLALRKGAFDNLKNFDFFTHFTIAEQRSGAAEAKGFRASIENGTLIYRFVTPLPHSVDPHQVPLVFSIHDESFYVNVRVPGDWFVRFREGSGRDCTVSLEDDKGRPLYLGAFFPTNVEVRCGAQ